MSKKKRNIMGFKKFLRERKNRTTILGELNRRNAGLWISPRGEIVEVRDNHGMEVYRHPRKFGLSKLFYDNLLDKYGETPGEEGRAREEVIRLLLDEGWIRVRQRRNSWSVNVGSLNGYVTDILREWIKREVLDGNIYPKEEFKIIPMDDRVRTLTAEEIMGFELETDFRGPTVKALEELEDMEPLIEVKLARVYQHFTSDRPVGIISAFRPPDEATHEQNVKNNRKIERHVRTKGFGFVWVDGSWLYQYDDGTEEEFSEVALMIIGDQSSQEESERLYNLLVEEGERYNQDAVIFKPAMEQTVLLVDPRSERVEMKFNRLNLDQVAQNFTRLRYGSHAGRPFNMEEVEPHNWAAQMKMEAVYQNIANHGNKNFLEEG